MKKISLLVLFLIMACSGFAQTTTFGYTGAVQTYIVPAGVTAISVDVQGANGGGIECGGPDEFQSKGGCGGRVQATLNVTPGHTLNITVGGSGSNTGPGGYGGGGKDPASLYSTTWPGAGGGGGTTITDATAGTTLVVAGGGGGGGGDFCAAYAGGYGDDGGAGGGTTGAAGNADACGIGLGGKGGTPIAGGAGSTCDGTGGTGAAGTGANVPATADVGSGAGGGGWFGGGSGSEGAGGGGGSSYTNPTYTTSFIHTQGYNCAAGTAIITVACSAGTITGTGIVCTGATRALTDATTGGTWSSSATGTASVSATGVVSGATAGTATISYIMPAGCYATAVVTVVTTPTAILGTAYVCSGSTTTLSDAVAGGTWSSSTTTVATIVSTTGVVTGLGPGGTSTITYITSGACSITTIVTVNTQPTAILGSFSLCEGSTTLLTDAVAGGTWSSSNTAVAGIGTDGTVTASSTTTGTSTIMYAIGSCSVTQVVTVNTLPVAITGNTPVCQTFTIGLTDATAGGTWTVAPPPGIATITGGGVVTGTGVGTAIVSYTIGSCAATTIVTVNTQPTAILGSFSLCEGSTTLLTDAVAGGTWSSSNTAVAGIGTNGTVTASSTTTGTSTIMYAIGSCSVTQVVTVNTLPAAITGNTPVCQTFTIGLTDATAGGAWTVAPPPGIATITGSGVVTGVGVGTAIVSYTIGSCAATTIVTVNTQPTAILGSFSLCEGSTTLLTDAVAGGAWSSGNTLVATISGGGTVTASGTTTGTSTIMYAIGSCSVTQVVTVTTLPVAITGNIPVCQTFTIDLTDATAGGAWTVAPPPGIATITGSGVVTGVGVGTAIVSYTIGSCAATTIVTVNTQPTAILGSFSLCEGSTTLLTDAVAGGAWSSSNTLVATISGGGTVTASGTTTGTSTIMYAIGSCSVTQVVTVTTLPVAITGNTPVCQTFTIDLTDATAGGAWTVAPPPGIATITGGGVVTGVGVGTAIVSYTIGSCAATTIVTVDTQPAAITGTLYVCKGLTTTLADGTGGGAWSVVPPPGIATITGGVVTGVAAGTAIISYTLGICAAEAVVTVNPLPAPISGTLYVCAGATTDLTDGTTGCTWTSSNVGVATIGGTTGIVSALGAGNSTITCGNTATGCQVTAILTVNPLPAAISGNLAVCQGLTTTLTDATTGCTWTSTITTVATVGLTTGVVTGLSPGTSTIICENTATTCEIKAIVTVNPLPTAIGGPTLVCVGSTITLTDGTAGGTWSSSNGLDASVGLTTGVVTGIVGSAVTITYTLGSGCYVTYAVTVDAQAAVITPVGDTTFCPGGFVALTANTGAGLNYQWYVGGVAISGALSSSYIASIAGSYQVMVTNSLGCSTLSIPMLVIIDTPVASITLASGGTTICAGSTAILDANTGVGLSYQWLNDAGAITGAVGSTYGATTAGDYSAVVTNATGCSDTSNVITISINPSPFANVVVAGPLTFCQGGSVAMYTGDTAGYSYQWYNGAGAIYGANGPSYTATAAGTYYLIVTNSYSCTGTSANITVVVNPLPGVSIAESGSTLFCAGGSVTLSATAVAGDTYQWYVGGSAISGATSSSYLVTTSGGYQVQVTNPTTGCTAETLADTVVTVIGTPVVVPVTPASFCWGGSSLLSTTVLGSTGTVSYQWYFNGAIIPGATGATYNATIPGNYSCLISIPGSCTAMAVAIPVTEYPLPDPVVTLSGTTFQTGAYYVTYQWYKNLAAIAGATTNSTPETGSGSYKVQVTDTNGCQSFSDAYVFTGTGLGGTTGVQNINNSGIRIYPNPAQTMVHIESAIEVRALINSIDGRAVLDVAAAKEVDISNLADGIYMIMLYDASGQMLKAEKLVKTSN